MLMLDRETLEEMLLTSTPGSITHRGMNNAAGLNLSAFTVINVQDTVCGGCLYGQNVPCTCGKIHSFKGGRLYTYNDGSARYVPHASTEVHGCEREIEHPDYVAILMSFWTK